MTPAHTAWSRARRARDARFDGRFFVAVTTTGIYCRPVCPAPSPLERHVRYFESAAAAAEAGFRPCLRCRPEVAPGSPAWLGTPATVQRALRLIEAGVPDGIRVHDLATSLGMGPRHLHRLFLQHLGASPLAVIQTRRLHFAKQLVDGTTLPLAEIALAAGFGSIRRFNAAVRQTWNRTPSSLRREHGGRREAPFEVVLAYRPPYDWDGLLDFLARRAVAGIEHVERGRYLRTVEVGGDAGWIEVSHEGARHGIRVSVHVDSPRALYRVVAGVRRMFDLDADPEAISAHLAPDPMLGPLVARAPGRRVPGSWDGFELAVRAIIGQQCSVAAARTLVGRIVGEYGAPLTATPALARLFPAAEVLADAPIERLGVLPRRAAAVRMLARAVASGRLSLTRESEAAGERAALLALTGIGVWTTEYVAMRSLGDPDAFPAGDLALARAAGLDGRALARRADAWRPWRAYAALHLWMGASHEDRDTRARGRREPRRAAAARRSRRGALRGAIPRSA